MRALVQRVSSASVTVEGNTIASISQGLLIFLGIAPDDRQDDARWLANKTHALRIFPDRTGNMNANIESVGGSFLVVSQFTLHARVKKGNRPSFINAAQPEIAIPLYQYFIGYLEEISHTIVKTGKFGAKMEVVLVNDGPVTLWIDTANKE